MITQQNFLLSLWTGKEKNKTVTLDLMLEIKLTEKNGEKEIINVVAESLENKVKQSET